MRIESIIGPTYYCIVDKDNSIIGDILYLDESSTAITAIFDEKGQSIVKSSSREELLKTLSFLSNYGVESISSNDINE